MQVEAEITLRRAKGLGRIGRFQIEAAIQSAHVAGLRAGQIDWASIALLHEGLLRIAPSAGAVVGHALAIGHAVGAAAGLIALRRLDPLIAACFQPVHAAMAHLLAMDGRANEAAAAYDRAIELTTDRGVAAYLTLQRDEISALTSGRQ